MIEVTSSDLAAVDRWYALRTLIRARIALIDRTWKFHAGKKDRVQLKGDFVNKALAAIVELEGMGARLDKLPLIDHTNVKGSADWLVYQDIKQEFELSYSNHEGTLLDIFGPSVRAERSSVGHPLVADALSGLKRRSIKARIGEHKWRLEEEVKQRSEEGWYVIFNTLTVAPHAYKSVFEKGSRDFRDYIRRFDNAIASSCYGSVRLAKGQDYHSYFGVVERGDKYGRLHIHVLHMCKDLPESWKVDPNAGRAIASNREVVKVKPFWRFGHSKPLACRFVENDAFSRAGWRWPVEKKGLRWRPVRAKPAIAVARYIVKYVLKGYHTHKGEGLWRTRISRGLGLRRMIRCVKQCTTIQVLGFLRWNLSWLEVQGRRFPGSCLRREFLRELLKRWKSGNSGSWRHGWRRSMLLKSLREVRPQPPFGERLQCLYQRIPTSNCVSCTHSPAAFWRNSAAFEVYGVFEKVFSAPYRRAMMNGG